MSSEVNFGSAITICMTKYADFNGRAARPEFWWFQLFVFLLNIVVALLLGDGLIANLVSVAFLLPTLAVGSRRLHDIGKSGWWQLLSLTIIGIILLIYWFVQPGDQAENEYGNSES